MVSAAETLSHDVRATHAQLSKFAYLGLCRVDCSHIDSLLSEMDVMDKNVPSMVESLRQDWIQ